MTAPGDNLRRLTPEARIEELRRQIEALTQADPHLDKAQQIVARVNALRQRRPKK
jgi:hypothetical protein